MPINRAGLLPAKCGRLANCILTWARVLAILSVTYNNAAAFDFNNLLTSNGGDPGTDDLGSETGK